MPSSRRGIGSNFYKAESCKTQPDPAFINQSPPLLEAATKAFARKADVTILDETEEVFEDAVEEIEEDIEPDIKMADFDYDEYTVTSDGLVRY